MCPQNSAYWLRYGRFQIFAIQNQKTVLAWILGNFPKKFKIQIFLDIQMANLGLKVITFLNSPANVHFENDLIFNPNFTITANIEALMSICVF